MMHGTLSHRELDVLRRIVAGADRRDIAMALGVSPRTIDAHRDRIRLKLGARNVADIVRIALKTALLDGAVA